MNCKPGDLAVIIRDGNAYHRETGRVVPGFRVAGLIVRVVRFVDCPFGMGWEIEQPCKANGLDLLHIDDASLRPLPPESDVETFDAEKSLTA